MSIEPEAGRRESSEATPAEQERQLTELWSDPDRSGYRQTIALFERLLAELQDDVVQLNRNSEECWDRFVPLSLEILQRPTDTIANFAELRAEVERLTPVLTTLKTRLDRIATDIVAYRSELRGKARQLAALTHPISTLDHIQMMLARIEHLEALFATDADAQDQQLSAKTTGDLLYLRVRLRTTRLAILAARMNHEIDLLQPILYSLVFRVERLGSELKTTGTLLTCLRDQIDYWLAFYTPET